jgi:ParB-like chromosome segregation protein Spo0J
MKIKKIKISKLKLDRSNLRTHPDRNLDVIKSSLKKFGQQKPIVIDSAGFVVAGNGTLTAALSLGWDEIETIETTLEGKNAIAYAIADNRTAELATWNDEKLYSVIESGVDSSNLGFNAMEIEQMKIKLSEFEQDGEVLPSKKTCPRCKKEI